MHVYSVVYIDPREGDFGERMENFTAGAAQKKRFNELNALHGIQDLHCEEADFTLNKVGILAAIEYGKSFGEVKPDQEE